MEVLILARSKYDRHRKIRYGSPDTRQRGKGDWGMGDGGWGMGDGGWGKGGSGAAQEVREKMVYQYGIIMGEASSR